MKKLRQIVTVVIRGPCGEMSEDTPIYDEIEVNSDGFTAEEKRANSIYADFLAKMFKKSIANTKKEDTA